MGGAASEITALRSVYDKARISIQSTFVTFVVAYAPTEDATEREKAKYMATLNSTVKPVPSREHVFVLTDANARTGKR